MRAKIERGFDDEVVKAAFGDGFQDEIVSMEKEGILPLLAPALILGGGAAVAGLTGFGKPKDIIQRKWYSPREIPKTLGFFAGKAGPLISLGLGEGTVSRPPLAWRPTSIAQTPLSALHRKTPGGF